MTDVECNARLAAVEAECARIREARAAEALRVTAGYTTEELRAMPDSALSRAYHKIKQLEKECDAWQRLARDLESLCADRL